MTAEQTIRDQLEFAYGAEAAPAILSAIQSRLDTFRQRHPEFGQPGPPAQRVTEADSILITYGDQIQEPGQPALRSLAEVLDAHLKGIVSSVHLLPFYPYTSDDGFSVVDYTAVDPALGDWPDVTRVGQNFRLMFDAVINHISAHSAWFQGFLQGDSRYANYFITVDPATDLSGVTRPRALPLLTEVETATGPQHVWTTFSADQIDLNYANPQVLLEIIDVLLFYVAHGAEFIRLDAIAYMWKEIGTNCIHLPQTHRLIQLFRTILDAVAPNVLLITETNVPHAENVSYFGDGRNEAQMVYNFSLPPLILHTFHTGDATALRRWAAGLETLPDTATFFNFIASHDGLGVRPAEGILTPAEIQHLADKALAHGGHVSFKNNPDGSQSAYELNITLFDALSDPASDEPQNLQVDRFIASQAIMLALAGVPGLYIHSLFGSANDHIGVEETGRARSINRQKWLRAEVEAVLANPNSRSYQIFQRYLALLQARVAHPAFHPNGPQQILDTPPGLFGLLRTAPDGSERALCLHNITAQPQTVALAVSQFDIEGDLVEIILGETVTLAEGQLRLTVEPYGVKWLVG
ncbi:MAG: sugar phosphorylase [Anaerolineae bacterium]|nr:sugar phosphorylase [Anaerolineae bacterium]